MTEVAVAREAERTRCEGVVKEVADQSWCAGGKPVMLAMPLRPKGSVSFYSFGFHLRGTLHGRYGGGVGGVRERERWELWARRARE